MKEVPPKLVFEVGAEVAAGWIQTLAAVSKQTTIDLKTLQQMDVFDFFSLLKTIKQK